MFKEYFREKESSLIKELKISEFQHTSKILLNYYKKSKSIDNVISSTNFQKDFYPCIILIRSQIEHFIVAAYIWIQFRITENDNIAKNYHEEYLIYEVVKRLNYSKNNNISMSSKYSVAFRKILDILTDRKILKQKDFEKLNIKANQFDIKKISKFFDENLPLEYDNIIRPDRIKQFLENYNYFSSFVHGGPSADALMNEKYKTDFISEASELIEWSSSIVGFQRFFIVYFLSMKNETIKADLIKEIEKI